MVRPKLSKAIVLLDEAKNEVVRWRITNAWPRKWEGPDLNAKGNDVAVEPARVLSETD